MGVAEASEWHDFGSLLRWCRLSAELTQEALAERAGLGVRSIQGLEQGESRPRLETARRLIAALDLAGDLRARFETAARSSPQRHCHVDAERLAAPDEPSVPRTNLPLQLTSFVGRERELSAVEGLLQPTRLLSLVGSGGCGKTRLAYEVAARQVGSYRAGVWVVELASLSGSDLVVSAVASQLGLRESPGRSLLAVLIEHLKPRHLLLVLDNCEHLVEACARLAEALLSSCSDLTILATTRETLRVPGEVVYQVPSLSTPPLQEAISVTSLSSYESVRLFVERAQAAHFGFRLTEENGHAVGRICHELDGIPLALELAAARVRVLPVDQIASRLYDRFRLLKEGSRTALPRQQTLKATLDWSYDLLSAAERVVLRRLAVFAGGFSLEAAEAVCSGVRGEVTIEREDVLDLLLRLVGRSLVMAEDVGEEGRYRFLETIRQYALEKLMDSGEVAPVRDRHRDCYLSLAALALTLQQTVREVRRYNDRLDLEHDNLRAALSWCVETDPSTGLEIAGYLCNLWIARGFASEGRYWLRELLARVPERTVVRARALVRCSWLASDQGDLAEARMLAEESLEVAREIGDVNATIYGLHALGEVVRLQGDRSQAMALLEDALALGRAQADTRLQARVLHWLGLTLGSDGDYHGARECWEEAVALLQSLDAESLTVGSSAMLGFLDQTEGNYGRARSLLEESVAICRKLGDLPGIGWMLSHLGYTIGRGGDLDRGVLLLQESILVSRDLGHRLRLGRALCLLALLEDGRGARVRAVRLIGTAMGLIGDSQPEFLASERVDRDACLIAARTALGEEAFARARAEGQEMTLEQAVEYALRDGEG